MDAYISSIEFIRKDKDNCYWKIILVDENNNYLGTFGDSNITDEVNFRKQTFGILSACNCYDLLKLGSSNPELFPIFFKEKYYGGVDYIVNKSGKKMILEENGYYDLKKAWNFFNKNKEIKKYEVAEIESIKSQSGVFNILLTNEHFSIFYVTGSVYWGFGYPLSEENMNEKYIKEASKLYTSFIECILDFYDTNDLLKLSKKENLEYPKVTVDIDDFGKITSIGSSKTGLTLTQNENSYLITKKDIQIKDVSNNKCLTKKQN